MQFKILIESLIHIWQLKQLLINWSLPVSVLQHKMLRITISVYFYNIVVYISFYPTWGHLHITLFKNKLYSLSQVFTSYSKTKVHIIGNRFIFIFGLSVKFKTLIPFGDHFDSNTIRSDTKPTLHYLFTHKCILYARMYARVWNRKD